MISNTLPQSLIDNPILSQWIAFEEKGRVGSGKVEIGQGILTALSQIAAEELDLRPEQINLVSGQTDVSPAEGFTSGSYSIAVGGASILTLVDGLLSKSHLVLQEKSDGEPVVLPSKDLRAFDESLERVIIIDDNPKLIVQHHRHRLIKKFQADPYLAAKLEGHGLAAPYEQALPAVVKEIEESLELLRRRL